MKDVFGKTPVGDAGIARVLLFKPFGSDSSGRIEDLRRCFRIPYKME